VRPTDPVSNVALGLESCRFLEVFIFHESSEYWGLVRGKLLEIELVLCNGCLSARYKWGARLGLFSDWCFSGRIHPCDTAMKKVEDSIEINARLIARIFRTMTKRKRRFSVHYRMQLCSSI
jgi:hypothetical protein